MNTPQEAMKPSLALEVREAASPRRTTLHFERSEIDSHIFSRVAQLIPDHELRRATTKEDFFKSLLITLPNQIVINCASGRREGLQLVEDIGKINHLSNVPIVVLSDDADERSIRSAFALGATRYFVRPVLLEEYRECVLGILSNNPNLDQGIAGFEKFPPSENKPVPKPSLPPKPFHAYSLLGENQTIKRYPWVYHTT